MDKKTLLLIFTGVSMAIISGFIYRKYRSLTDEIASLKEQLKLSNSDNSNELSSKLNNISNRDIVSNESSLDETSISSSQHTAQGDFVECDPSNTIVNNCKSDEDDSIIRTRNEVDYLQQELKNVEGLINEINSKEDTSCQENIVQSVNIMGSNCQSDRMSSSKEQILSLNPIHSMKNNISEFEDLANVPSDNNSELNQLIQKESQINDTILQYSLSNENNESSINNDYTSEMSKDNNINVTDDRQAVEHTIKLDLIIKNFSKDQLKDICKENNLPIGGPKIKLINRIIDKGLGHLLNNTPEELNQSELLQ